MKETVVFEFVEFKANIPPGPFLLDDENVTALSRIVWGEHCSECAYPTCYSSCAFYDPRSDLQCRRFEAGIESAGHGLSRIRFRKWGKLEGRGPIALHEKAAAAKLERRDRVVSKWLANTRLPFSLARYFVWYWNQRKNRAGRASRPSTNMNDAFAIEAYVRNGARAFTVTFLQSEPKKATYQKHITLTDAPQTWFIPVAELSDVIDLARPYLIQIEPVGEAEGIDAVFGALDFVRLRTPLPIADASPPPAAISAAPPSALAKVVVWDLDETIWTGTLAEEGAQGVHPRPEAVAAIKALDARGILQSIASKNDLDEALEALHLHGLADYFLYPQVNWGPKSESIARIAKRLDLGVDSFVFIDDQPFERAEALSGHETLRVLTHEDVAHMLTNPWFNQPVTAEGARRRELYRTEAQRVESMEQHGGDYHAFLRASALVIEVRDLDTADMTRAHELSQRTNQLNFTGAKFSRDEVERVQGDLDRRYLTVRCRDRYGDYGLIGFVVLDVLNGRIEAFFMSCRVQRKRVEQALFAYLAALLSARGHARFAVRFKETKRNGAARDMLEELGFSRDEDGWTRDLSAPFEDSDIVKVETLSPHPAAG
ncbi:HAD-IIIC family phosphatase [Pararobbsia silviterrae]|uniref:HAD-IIIC family phosphatase n=1 Tax=Pararobbsia silviterrae TaxID=1792498 RepID=UPI001313E301|nr:HAD-IIIC family phosphatase [Pararobbsia silviterrae]